jgi:protein-tyrosine-phosphatase
MRNTEIFKNVGSSWFSKVVMLSAYAEGAQRCREIPDPYFGDLEATRRCYALLQTCIHNLAAELGAHNPDPVAPAST